MEHLLSATMPNVMFAVLCLISSYCLLYYRIPIAPSPLPRALPQDLDLSHANPTNETKNSNETKNLYFHFFIHNKSK